MSGYSLALGVVAQAVSWLAWYFVLRGTRRRAYLSGYNEGHHVGYDSGCSAQRRQCADELRTWRTTNNRVELLARGIDVDNGQTFFS